MSRLFRTNNCDRSNFFFLFPACTTICPSYPVLTLWIFLQCFHGNHTSVTSTCHKKFNTSWIMLNKFLLSLTLSRNKSTMHQNTLLVIQPCLSSPGVELFDLLAMKKRRWKKRKQKCFTERYETSELAMNYVYKHIPFNDTIWLVQIRLQTKSNSKDFKIKT